VKSYIDFTAVFFPPLDSVAVYMEAGIAAGKDGGLRSCNPPSFVLWEKEYNGDVTFW